MLAAISAGGAGGFGSEIFLQGKRRYQVPGRRHIGAYADKIKYLMHPYVRSQQ
jgi:hypothetical protein